MLFVTGCQRSGTMTYARVLELPHEKVFNPITLKEIPELTKGECSWMIAPFSKQLLEQGHSILRIVRHPFKVIRSLLGINFWTEDGHKPYRDFILENVSIKGNDPLEASLSYWVEWNKLIPQVPTIRIEDLINGPQLNRRNRLDSLRPTDIEYTDEARFLMDMWGYK